MKTIFLFLIACSLGISADKIDPALAGMNSDLLARIPVRMKEFVDAGKTAGIVTLIARHGHIASLEAVGFQDVDRNTPMQADSIFRIMSVTKPITCAGVMTLVDEGNLPGTGESISWTIRRDVASASKRPECQDRGCRGDS